MLAKYLLSGGVIRDLTPGNIHIFPGQSSRGSIWNKSDARLVEENGLVTPPAKSRTELYQRMQNPKWAIVYIAAIMRYHADVYGKIAGVNISNSPSILASLFNDGRSEERARDLAIKRKTRPYQTPQTIEGMGTWVNDNRQFINNMLGGGNSTVTTSRPKVPPPDLLPKVPPPRRGGGVTYRPDLLLRFHLLVVVVV